MERSQEGIMRRMRRRVRRNKAAPVFQLPEPKRSIDLKLFEIFVEGAIKEFTLILVPGETPAEAIREEHVEDYTNTIRRSLGGMWNVTLHVGSSPASAMWHCALS